MGFWIFVLAMALLCPAVMIVMGRVFLRSSPKDINYIYGYRTAMSMKNRDTWEFAHKLCGKVWFIGGLVLLPVNLVPMLVVIGKSKDIVGGVGAALSFVGLAALLGSLIPVERALKRTFDKNGNRRSPKNSKEE